MASPIPNMVARAVTRFTEVAKLTSLSRARASRWPVVQASGAWESAGGPAHDDSAGTQDRQAPGEESGRPAGMGSSTVVATVCETTARREITSRQTAGAPTGAGGVGTDIGFGEPAGRSAEETRPRASGLGLDGTCARLVSLQWSLDGGPHADSRFPRAGRAAGESR